ncbi:nucleotidyltransferase substrate binding protein, HI0074 family [Salegentibacter echinorum]|uniref:Nucleotidyltransferase substrate binding protein, HI0074 family n=1 Tax=Salegentibacter echinorum TaxID=1073325 RepID=A0A1M5KTC4_SALEC|nr:nucleotidyltransferase substrate binding protein [Salegentibacter echinorum]SHG55413.1 nucleotidyltransferase substrate binding protein, HI0074 family [Salegentibacter echinorum]
MEPEEKRWQQRFQNYKKALQQLENAVELAKKRKLSELEMQGLIQSFEYTHELAWKTIKDFLKEKGNFDIYGSRDATRQAFGYGLIKNGETWINMILSRNKTSHTYNEETAKDIVLEIRSHYFKEFKYLEDKFNVLDND